MSLKIGVISPANSIIGEKNIKEFKNGVKKLEEIGFEVIVGKNVFSDSCNKLSGTIEEKIEDLYDIASQTKYIICSTGGINSNVLLDKIDFNKIKNNIFIGNSNPVLLFNAFYKKNKINSYIGPNVKTLGKMESDFSINCLKNKIINNSKLIDIEEETKIIKNGFASGIAIGGNIQSIRRILGTKYFPNIKDYILYIEADPTETSKEEYESIISQFEQANIIKQASGIILGYYTEDNIFYEKLFKDFNGPIVICNNLGHKVNNNMFPIGKEVIINGRQIIEK